MCDGSLSGNKNAIKILGMACNIISTKNGMNANNQTNTYFNYYDFAIAIFLSRLFCVISWNVDDVYLFVGGVTVISSYIYTHVIRTYWLSHSKPSYTLPSSPSATVHLYGCVCVSGAHSGIVLKFPSFQTSTSCSIHLWSCHSHYTQSYL